MKRTLAVLILMAVLASGCAPWEREGAAAPPRVLRLGYMANITHAQALLGLGDGSLERSAGIKVVPKVFTAGPPAITALFAGEIDLLYVGPSPALNGYVRSGGEALRLLAGGASGGAVFVVKPGIDPQRLDTARLATPGIANTQDIALRHMLHGQGLRTREQGGSVRVTPTAPAEILGLFARGQLDGAWVAEPWGARLIQETGAVLAWDERDLWPDRTFATTVLAVSPKFLRANREAVKGFLAAHVAITEWIVAHPEEAKVRLQAELSKLQGKPLPDEVFSAAFSRIDFTYDPMVSSVQAQAQRAYDLGLLGAREPELSGLYDLTLLKEVAP